MGIASHPDRSFVVDDPGENYARLRRDYAWKRGGRRLATETYYRCGRAPALPVLVHRPRRPRFPGTVILYLHGGGWYLGSPLTHAGIGRALADASGLPVHSLDYRLMPGHSAWAPVRDGLTLLRRLVADGARDVVLAGDSAGAATCLAVVRQAPERLRRSVVGVLAFYGAFGLTRSDSIQRLGRADEGLDAAALAKLYGRLRHISDDHPFGVGALTGRRLPPLRLWVGDRDPLLDDSHALAEGASGMADDLRLAVVPGVGHGFLHDTQTQAARRTVAEAAQSVSGWLKLRPVAGRRAIGP